uniref:(California timema) hypothetical protein n=1 Tax=Timema californicum TaxID=61474 RepID=A0A7R9P8L8_TIMCA|nr:unnamed protein product [Timema californicum]
MHKYTMIIQQSDVMTAISSLSHWLCYANSAVNPVIYNFMSGKFRREFKRTILQCATSSRHSYHATVASDYPMSNTQGTLLLRGNTRRSNDTSRI